MTATKRKPPPGRHVDTVRGLLWPCPRCGGPSHVTETRANRRGLRRRRMCASRCGWKVTTQEIATIEHQGDVVIVPRTLIARLGVAAAAVVNAFNPPAVEAGKESARDT